METFPKLGMKFEQVRSRLLKDKKYKGDGQLTKSIINQCRLHEGNKAGIELSKEMESVWSRRDANNHSRAKLGYSEIYSEKFNSIFN